MGRQGAFLKALKLGRMLGADDSVRARGLDGGLKAIGLGLVGVKNGSGQRRARSKGLGQGKGTTQGRRSQPAASRPRPTPTAP
jgi:hypothetical protein